MLMSVRRSTSAEINSVQKEMYGKGALTPVALTILTYNRRISLLLAREYVSHSYGGRHKDINSAP